MAEIALQSLVKRLKEKRGHRGIREIAAEIKISPATLSRVERGNLPDLETFNKICAWLQIDPGEILGFRPSPRSSSEVRLHFKKDATMKEPTAKALGELILAAQARMRKEEGLES